VSRACAVGDSVVRARPSVDGVPPQNRYGAAQPSDTAAAVRVDEHHRQAHNALLLRQACSAGCGTAPLSAPFSSLRPSEGASGGRGRVGCEGMCAGRARYPLSTLAHRQGRRIACWRTDGPAALVGLSWSRCYSTWPQTSPGTMPQAHTHTRTRAPPTRTSEHKPIFNRGPFTANILPPSHVPRAW
jgi:hypothetical protein